MPTQKPLPKPPIGFYKRIRKVLTLHVIDANVETYTGESIMEPFYKSAVNELKSLIKTNEDVRRVLEALVLKQRKRNTTDLRRLRQDIQNKDGTFMDATTFISVFSSFQKLKLGVLKSPNPKIKNDTARFNWSINYLELARDVLGVSAITGQAASPKERAGWFQLPLRIRDTIAQLSLPADLTADEAEQICKFIRMYAR